MSGRLTKKRRDEIIVRDGGQCQSCEMTQEEHFEKFNRSLSIDHIDGHGRGSQEPNHEPSNLMTLCLSCHGRKDRLRRKKWSGGWKRPDKVLARRDTDTGKFIKNIQGGNYGK